MPNAAKTAEIDIYGRRMIGPCFNLNYAQTESDLRRILTR
jgi:hypothetical protein